MANTMLVYWKRVVRGLPKIMSPGMELSACCKGEACAARMFILQSREPIAHPTITPPPDHRLDSSTPWGVEEAKNDKMFKAV